MTINAISIPLHSTKSTPSPHVVYQIDVDDDIQGSYTIWKRYSDFEKLDAALRKHTVAPTKTLPPKSNAFTSFLDDNFLNNRRYGLEQYLQHLSLGKLKGIWTDLSGYQTEAQKAFQDFVAKPQEDTATAGDKAKLNANPNPDSRGWTFKGCNSYYLHSLQDDDRSDVLSAVQKAGFTVIRIFIAAVGANNKGSNNQAVNDLEPSNLGGWDDTVLEKIDQLMLECSKHKIKLLISCHDRYALGFWATDVYATKFGIAKAGSSGAQQIADASAFYTNNDAKVAIDNRIDHILSHKNTKMDNKTWAELDDVIYAIEPQNEPMGHMKYASTTWIPDRAGRIKQNIASGSKILVANGGGVDISTSTTNEHLKMANVDVVCVHDYGTSPWDTIPNVSSAAGTAANNGKKLVFEEWGANGNNKASVINDYVNALWSYGIDWLYWEITKPGAGSSDYEVWTDEDAWDAVTQQPK